MAPSREGEGDHQGKRLVTVLKKNKNRKGEDDDCVLLDEDPDKPVKVVAGNMNESTDDLLIIAEKGQIACRDYPHARHLCATFPFNTYPHEKYCDKCYCYVCDTRAPCVKWGTGTFNDDHCHSTDKEEVWRVLRQSSSKCEMAQLATITLSNALGQLSLQSDRLTGKVKWYSWLKGYGFICPDDGGEDLFVYESSVKSEYGKRFSKGDLVEFQIECEGGERRKAIDVSTRRDALALDQLALQGGRLRGYIMWFYVDRGYGFIRPDLGGDNLFFHKSSLAYKGPQILAIGHTVWFNIERGEDGRLKATAVSIPSSERIVPSDRYKHLAVNCHKLMFSIPKEAS